MKSEEGKRELLARLDSERKRQWLWSPAAAMALLAILGLLACLAAAAAFPPALALKACAWALGACVALCLACAAAAAFKKSPPKREAAVKLDDSVNGKSRLEAFVELDGSSNPLRAAQEEEASKFYSKSPSSPWALFIALMILAALLLLAGQGAVVCVELALLKEEQAKEAKLQADAAEKEKRKEAERKVKEEFANLEITAPEAESRAKPVDEIIIQAAGASSNGFSSLTLEVAVNGDRHVSLPVENPPLNAPGAISIESSLLLEELQAMPFDLISYNLKGLAKVGGKDGVEILSLPQFIQVRPFREDAKLMNGMAGQMQKAMDSLLAFMREQIALNKALFVARNAGLDAADKALLEQIGVMAKDQGALGKDLADFLAKADPKTITPNMFENIDKAVRHMGEAAAQLALEKPELPAANDTQQKAIADLIAALKEVQKALVMAQGQSKPSKQEEDPFKDKQGYKKPEMPPSENMENKLADSLKAETEIVDKLEEAAAAESSPGKSQKKQPSMKELSAKQSKISQELSSLGAKDDLKKETGDAIKQAGKSSGNAEEAMKSAETRDALAAASKAKADIKDALDKVRSQSAESMEKALAEAQKKLNEAARELEKGAKKEAAKDVDAAAGEIEKEAMSQHKQGSQAKAEDLAELAKKLDAASPARKLRDGAADKQEAAKKVEEMKELVAAVRERVSDPKGLMDNAISRMEKAAKELEFAAKNPNAASKEERREMLSEAELAMQDAARASKNDGKDGKDGKSPGDKGKGGKQDGKGKEPGGKSPGDAEGKDGEPGGKAPGEAADKEGAKPGGQGGKGGLAQNLKSFKPRFDNALSYPDPDKIKPVLEGLKSMIEIAKAEAEAARSKESLRKFSPDEVPKAYRDDVSNYFKRLSEGSSN